MRNAKREINCVRPNVITRKIAADPWCLKISPEQLGIIFSGISDDLPVECGSVLVGDTGCCVCSIKVQQIFKLFCAKRYFR